MNGKSNKVLLLVDCQYDFLYHGKLGVKETYEKMDALTEYVKEHGEEYVGIIATVDWHPITHCSFTAQGGVFPPHCLQHSKGAAIYEPLINACNEAKTNFVILTKGDDEEHEQFSIMKNPASAEKLVKFINAYEVKEIDVVGIAGDYCVKDTMADIHKVLPNVKLAAIPQFIASIDGGAAFNDFLAKNESIEVKIV